MSDPKLKWPDDRKEALKEMYARGLSASQTAAELNCGITRNAVIGMWHRLKLERRGVAAGIRRSVKVKPPGTPKPPRKHRRTNVSMFATRWGAYDTETKPGELPPDPVVDLVPLDIGLSDIRPLQCRWVTTEKPALFCGHPTLVGSWCPVHRALVFTPLTEKRGSLALELAA